LGVAIAGQWNVDFSGRLADTGPWEFRREGPSPFLVIAATPKKAAGGDLVLTSEKKRVFAKGRGSPPGPKWKILDAAPQNTTERRKGNLRQA